MWRYLVKCFGSHLEDFTHSLKKFVCGRLIYLFITIIEVITFIPCFKLLTNLHIVWNVEFLG